MKQDIQHLSVYLDIFSFRAVQERDKLLDKAIIGVPWASRPTIDKF